MSPMQTCDPWPFEEDCCSLPEGDHDALIAKMSEVATDHLWAAGGRVHGPCPVTVRPCLRSCDHGLVSWGSALSPYIDSNGAWRNAASCGCSSGCSCTELCEIVLEGPVAGVDEVTVDGEAIAEDSYRLDVVGEQVRLVATDGCFPSCQDMSANDGEVGSFVVVYQQGLALTQAAIAAHSELVCELVKLCIPGCKCRLPANAVRVTRTGVAIDLDAAHWIRSLPLVDAWLDMVNPNGLMKPLRVASPDARGTRRAWTPGNSSAS